jgi:putative colanic acid biosynthesis acetyltransferase WcaF
MTLDSQQPGAPPPPAGPARVDVSHYHNIHSLGNRAARALWGVVWLLLFRPSPRPCHAWRRMLLRLFGAQIGRGAHVQASVKIWAPWNLRMDDHSCLAADVDCYCVAPIRIGAHTTVSQYSYLCGASHDFTRPDMPLIFAPIIIEDQAWVCADCFVAMGVTIGQGAVVGARSNVTKDVPPWTVVAGNPARVIKPRRMVGKDA